MIFKNMKTMSSFFIYGRYYNYVNYIKVGITYTPIERNQVYITGEFIFIIEITDTTHRSSTRLDKMIKKQFEYLRYTEGTGGTESSEIRIVRTRSRHLFRRP